MSHPQPVDFAGSSRFVPVRQNVAGQARSDGVKSAGVEIHPGMERDT